MALYFLLLLWMACWVKVEAFFAATPWLRRGSGEGRAWRSWHRKRGSAPLPTSPPSGRVPPQHACQGTPRVPPCRNACRHCGKMQAAAGGRKYATRCPFTGEQPHHGDTARAVLMHVLCVPASGCCRARVSATLAGPTHCTQDPEPLPAAGHKPTMRCPSCDARVHDSAFHKTDRLVA